MSILLMIFFQSSFEYAFNFHGNFTITCTYMCTDVFEEYNSQQLRNSLHLVHLVPLVLVRLSGFFLCVKGLL